MNLSNRVVRLRIFFCFFLMLGTFQAAFAANLKLSPSGGTYAAGATFSVDVLVTNNEDSINAVSAAVNFNGDVLELRSISKSGSIIGVWAEDPSFSNASGNASMEGVILNPGFSGSQGKVVTLSFRAKKAGIGNVTLSSGSVLANDGNATNILGTLGSAAFTISEGTPVATTPVPAVESSPAATDGPVVTSSTHPNSEKWYNSNEASFDWKLTPGVTAVRTLYNATAIATPNKVYDPPVTNRSFVIDGEGTMYMHVQFKIGSTWGSVTHFKFNVDRKAPESLKASLPDGAITTNPTPAVLVLAEDADSGVDHIMMSVDDGTPVSSPVDSTHLYRIPKSSPGNHTVAITAVDKANNASSVSLDYTIQTIAIPVITEYTKTLESGTAFRVSGTTYPQTTIEVALTDRDGKITTQSTTSDSNGIFALTWKGDIPTGVYEMRARAIDSKGAASDYTDGKAIVAEHLALIRIGLFIMNWLSLLLIIILAGALAAATLWYSFTQFARFRRKVRRTMLDAENALKMNVQGLRRDLEDFRTLLLKTQKKRELTKEETAILKKFNKRIDITEKEIEQKLESIG